MENVEGVVKFSKYIADPIFVIVKPAVYGRRIYYEDNLVNGIKERDNKNSLVNLVKSIHEKNVSGLNLLFDNLVVNSNNFYITDFHSAKLFGKDSYSRKMFDELAEKYFEDIDFLFGGNAKF